MSKFEKKAINFSKTCSSLKKRFFGHVECSFDTSQEIFWSQAFKNGSKSKIYGKNTYFEKKKFFSKLSSGPIESSFDKRLFLLKVREWQNRSPNLRKKLLKIIFCSRIMQFRDRSRKILPFSQRFCLKIWKRFFSKKTMFSKTSPGLFQQQFGHYEEKTTKIVLPKVQEMFDPNPKNMENKFFEINPFSLKTILSAHRKQFWQTLRIVCAKSPKYIN